MPTNPNPGPDPAAVRKALAEIQYPLDVWEYAGCREFDSVDPEHHISLVAAARAWLEYQEGNNQHTRGPMDCRSMKGASE